MTGKLRSEKWVEVDDNHIEYSVHFINLITGLYDINVHMIPNFYRFSNRCYRILNLKLIRYSCTLKSKDCFIPNLMYEKYFLLSAYVLSKKSP